ncbi:hypothetical protein [Cricetibacter osteomyelitidis]|uniref:hypothetical protein n=1 Tax=Cricetibacter osteomyelitidis TaxID=1521931 RepID=UPI00104D3FB3|nr:hypothetical protein [Cricetibacter osteomyelitidis]
MNYKNVSSGIVVAIDSDGNDLYFYEKIKDGYKYSYYGDNYTYDGVYKIKGVSSMDDYIVINTYFNGAGEQKINYYLSK